VGPNLCQFPLPLHLQNMVLITQDDLVKAGVKPTDVCDGTFPPLCDTLAQKTVKKGSKVFVCCGQLSLPAKSPPKPCYWEATFKHFRKRQKNGQCGVEVTCVDGDYPFPSHMVLANPPACEETYFILDASVEVPSDDADPAPMVEEEQGSNKKKLITLEKAAVDALCRRAWDGEDIAQQLDTLTGVSIVAVAKKLGLPVSSKGSTRADRLCYLKKELARSDLGNQLVSPEPSLTFSPQLAGYYFLLSLSFSVFFFFCCTLMFAPDLLLTSETVPAASSTTVLF
jgi:hypothetical protein